MSNGQLLPPKIQAQFVDRAKRGDYHYSLGSGVFVWIRGNSVITILGDHAGNVEKLTTKEIERKRTEYYKYARTSV